MRGALGVVRWRLVVLGLAAVLGLLLSPLLLLAGCATPPAEPVPGAVCRVALGEGQTARAVVVGRAWGLVDVRTDAPGFSLALVPPEALRCGGAR